jgi:imidazolonepropionase-like amidohydrolase
LAEAIFNNSSGADHVKIVQSGLNSLKDFGKQTPPQFSSDELSRAVHAANQLNLPVMVHTNGEIPTRIAIEAGCHSIEHGFFMGEDNLRQMADNGIFWVPTACTMKGYAEQLHGSKEADIARKNLDHQLEQIVKAKQFGVSIVVGTDAGCLGVHHGAAVIEELKLLMRAGFSLSEAICCATLNGAKLLGLKDAGRLAPGMKANFIAVKGTPACLPEGLESGLTDFRTD